MILSISDFTENLPLEVKMLGIEHRQEPINRTNGLPVFQWFFCVRGKGEIISDQQCSVVSEGQGFLIYPNIPHRYHGITPDWTVHFIGFHGTLCSELLSSLSMHSSGVYHLAHPTMFEHAIREFRNIYYRHTLNKAILFSSACYRFLLELSKSITYINPSELVRENQLLHRILAYLEQNFFKPVSLSDLSSITNYSKEYLCALFKKEMDQTIMHYLLTLRIQHAKIYLIQYPEKTVSEISRMCGFESPSYFGSQFRKATGSTPDQYRKSF